MPAKTKSPSRKVVASNSKQSNKFTQKFKSIPLFGKLLIAVVLLAGLTYGGWYGYNTFKASDLEAKAGAWTYLGKQVKVGIWACQYRSSTGAPGVKALYIREPSANQGYTMYIFSNSKDLADHVNDKADRSLRSAAGSGYWGGIGTLALSHSQAQYFRVSAWGRGPMSGGGTSTAGGPSGGAPVVKISQLNWC